MRIFVVLSTLVVLTQCQYPGAQQPPNHWNSYGVPVPSGFNGHTSHRQPGFNGNDQHRFGVHGNGFNGNSFHGYGNGFPGNGVNRNGFQGHGYPGNGVNNNGFQGNNFPGNGVNNGIQGNNFPVNGVNRNGLQGNGFNGNGVNGFNKPNGQLTNGNAINPNGRAGDSPNDIIGNPNDNPNIFKHVYVHVPPPEIEVDEERDQPKKDSVVAPPPQKHYKIIFIKTPSQKANSIQIPHLPQNEEKTLVYVLYKKPENQELVIPTAAPTNPTKPEVFFIKYKTRFQRNGSNGPGVIGNVPRSSNGRIDRENDNTASDVITGGSISDALLGAGNGNRNDNINNNNNNNHHHQAEPRSLFYNRVPY